MPSIEELLTEIKTLGDKKVSVEVFTGKIDELKAGIEKRNLEVAEEVKKTYGTVEEKMTKMAEEFSTKLTDAVKEMGKTFVGSAKPDENQPDEKTYGKSFGEFLVKVRYNDQELKTLSENTGSTGGYLVPNAWSKNILSRSIESSIIRNQGVNRIIMPTPVFDIPAIKSTSQSGSTYGGIITYWGNEGTNLANSKTTPTFEKISLNLQKLFGYTESYEDMNADSITALGPLLQRLFSDSIAFEEDYQFINGNGINKPLGVVNAECRVTVSRSTASQIHTEDVINMLSRFSGRLDNAVWIANQSTLPYIYKLQDAAGNYIWFPGMSGAITGMSPGSLYGLPLIISEKAQALGTEGDLILGDWSNYIIGDKDGLRIEESSDYKFGEDKRAWKIIKRVDAKPWLKSAITPKHGSTLSPFVTIG